MNSESHNYRLKTVSRPYDLFIGIGRFLANKNALVVVATCFAIISSVATTSAETVVLYGNIPDPFPTRASTSGDGYTDDERKSPYGAQPFFTGELGIVSSISLPMAVNGSPTGVVHFEIWDDISGRPGTKVAWVGDIDLDSWTGADLEYNLVTFDRPVIGLEPNTQYYVVNVNTDADVSGWAHTYFNRMTDISEGTNNAAVLQVEVNGRWIFPTDHHIRRKYRLMEILEISGVDILEPKLINVSTRGFVSTGAGVMIGGFVIGGETSGGSVLIRGIGPTLAGFGVANALEDPVIEVHQTNPDGSSTLVASNDDWGNNASIAAASETVGAFALVAGSKDAALLLSDLVPGSYTVHFSGKSDTVRVGFMEVYQVP